MNSKTADMTADIAAAMTAAMTADITADITADTAARRVQASNETANAFFTDNAESIARACHAMASRFQQGGRLLVYGDSARPSDVAHVIVEFLHPVVVGKRALPAIALRSRDSLTTFARDTDILLVFEDSGTGDGSLVAEARRCGLLTVCLSGVGPATGANFHFAVPSHDPCIVQETHEMLYHVLWELVHVFFEHRAVGV